MAFKGYYIKFIKGEDTWKLPLSYMFVNSWESNPLKVQDLDPYYDANGLLHRNPVEHTSATLRFSTPPMFMKQKEEFMSKLRSMMTNTFRRDFTLEYYNDETGNYDTGDFYMVEPSFGASKNTSNGILYNSIDIEFIKY